MINLEFKRGDILFYDSEKNASYTLDESKNKNYLMTYNCNFNLKLMNTTGLTKLMYSIGNHIETNKPVFFDEEEFYFFTRDEGHDPVRISIDNIKFNSLHVKVSNKINEVMN